MSVARNCAFHYDVTIEMSGDEYKLLNKAAQEAGVPLKVFIMEAALEEAGYFLGENTEKEDPDSLYGN